MRAEMINPWTGRIYGRPDNSLTERGHRWVSSHDRREKRDYPYSYSEFYLWGKQAQTDHGVYSDRLRQWSDENWKRAWGAMKADGLEKRFGLFGAKDASLFLTHYYGWPVTCTALIEGCNQGNGYPYWVFYFKSGF